MTFLSSLENIIIPYPATGWKSAFSYDSYTDAIEFVKQKINQEYNKDIPVINSIKFYYIRNNETNANIPEFVVWRDLKMKNTKIKKGGGAKSKYIDYVIIENPSNQFPIHYINQGNEAINQKFNNFDKSKIEILNTDHINFHDTTWNDSVMVIWTRIDPDSELIPIESSIKNKMTIPNPFIGGGNNPNFKKKRKYKRTKNRVIKNYKKTKKNKN